MKNILSHIRQHPLAQRIALCAILPAMVVMPEQVHANPSGGTVIHGAAEINADIEGHLQIFQTSNKAIINWEDFSIGEGELTQFIQPGVNATALSRVISGNPSALMGTLQANGGHILVNPNGIVVGANGVVDVAGMNVLSTLNVSDDQFLAGGDMVFTGTTPAGVTNFGTISSSEGDVILMGNFVDNQGSIGAVNGTVALGAGGSILLSSAGDAKISVQGAGAGGNTGVSNSGEITAATAELKAHGNVYALAVNNSGTIRATGFNRANGRVTLSAGEPGGSIVNTGSIRATNADGSGGMIDINAGPEGTVDIAGGEVVADGESAGGTINVVGSTVNVAGGARVTANGDTGGSVTVGSPEFTTAVTTEAGTIITANGAGGQGGAVKVMGTPESVMTLGGTLSANGADGGSVTVNGGTITQTETGVFSANGENDGGVISVVGSEVVLSGLSEVNGVNGNGGIFQANAEENLTVTETGVVNANGGQDGGIVRMAAENGDLLFNGTANANGEAGDGGMIEASAPNGDLSVGETGVLNANGGENGGTINATAGGDLTINGAANANGVNGNGGTIFADSAGVTTVNGSLNATGGENGFGGRIAVTGNEVVVGGGATVDASGVLGGGRIFAGGDFQGGEGGLREAQKTTVAAGAQFRADSTIGNAGAVVVWADGDTFFEGAITAQALGSTGNGGLIEVSGKQNLTFAGDVSASAVNGLAGTVLFDPNDILVTDTIGANQLRYEDLNDLLQGGTSVIIATESGSVTFENQGGTNDRDGALQWTNSLADFGVFASENVFINEHIRTSGGGSINIIAGWGGAEGDFGVGTDVTSFFDDTAAPGGSQFNSNDLLNDVEAVWEGYLEDGLFGLNGSVFIGSSTIDQEVTVGSRYGNTNVAASNLFITASSVEGGSESKYAQLGFRDTGGVFAVRGSHGFHNTALDLNDRALEMDNDPLVGLLPTIEDPANPGVFILDVTSPLLVDVNNDGIFDGVYAVNSNGILDENNTATGASAPGAGDGDATFIPFATHFNHERYGNWWWQQIDAENPDPLGLGGRLPENGAGQSVDVRADINVAVTGQVNMQGGGRHQNYAQIGHGGDSTAWADDQGLRSTTATDNISGENSRNYTYNGAIDGRIANSIARLAGVYGNINILAGLDRTTAQYNAGALTDNLTGTTDSLGGLVQLEGYQPTGSSNLSSNPEQGNASEAYVQIGHLGTGQFGSVTGDIVVQAGGDVNVLAGAHTRDHASIGHTVNGYAMWNAHSSPDQQIRFFANSGDLDNPNLRKGELFQNTDTLVGNARGFYEDGASAGRFDDDYLGTAAQTGTAGAHPGGVFGIAAMVGSTRKELVGDITVTSDGLNGITVKAYTNEDTRTATTGVDDIGDLDGDGVSAQLDGTDDADDTDGLQFVRDRRFAMIGHGGASFGFNDERQERVDLRITAGDGTGETSASVEVSGTDNSTRIQRGLTFMNILGDIEVTATRGGVSVLAGNDTLDFAAIGHGGTDLADRETSNVIIGDISVTGAGDLVLEGAGVEAEFTGASERSFRSPAQIGHHGNLAGLIYYAGDIDVQFGGDITLTGGKYRSSGAKIGHQSNRGYGQVGGEFSRTEEFIYGPAITDRSTIDLQTDVTATDVTIQVDLNSDGVFFGAEEVKVYQHSGYTADINVVAGANGGSGDVLMTHAEVGQANTQNQYALDENGGSNDIRWSNVQIGHGGRETASIRANGDNTAYNYASKIGNIDVTANGIATTDATTGAITTTGGNITLQNGEGSQGWWTTIGHALGNSGNDRANGPDNFDFSYLMAGDITINAFGNVLLDGQFANETDTTNVGGPGQGLVGDPADQNHVQIGHGGGFDGRDVVVPDTGTFRGIDLSSDIVVNAGNNVDIRGGNGSIDSHAQIGHGWATDNADEFSRPGGLNGDITVNVGNSLTLVGSPNAAVAEPSGIGATTFLTVEGAAAVIGHGGYQLDADLSGNISIYVGDMSLYNGDLADYLGNLTLQGSIRDAADDGATDSSSQPLGSVFNFAKIGHWSAEVDAIAGRGPVDSSASGNITVAVANDLFMNGGTTDDFATNPVVFAFAQIGNGGPGTNGAKTGDITVQVGNDFTTTDGTSQENSPGAVNSNNYVMVGNGDWVRDGSTFILPAAGGPGIRSGDISIAVGHSANFDHTLIGHADPNILTSPTTILEGNTFIGISRDFPFFGDNPSIASSDGTLTTDNDTVFTSSFYGLGSELRIYAPEREDILINDTRLNERTVTYNVADTDANFADSKGSVFDASQGQDAGRGDEIYLQPDLFFDDEGIATALGGEAFPASSADVQGGSVATVSDPGGFPNLVSLSAADFGTGTTEYRDANGVVGAGNYTFYFDAIQPVASVATPPAVGGGGGGGGGAPVVTPPIIFIPEVVVEEPVPVVVTPFNFLPFLFIDKFDSFDRDDLGLGDSQGGSIFDGLGILGFFTDRDDEEGLKDGDPISALLGFNDEDEDATVGDNEEDRRRNTRNRLLGKLGSIYYVYDVNAGEYSSFREFGVPASLIIE